MAAGKRCWRSTCIGIEQGTREQVGLVRELKKFPEMRVPRPRLGQTGER